MASSLLRRAASALLLVLTAPVRVLRAASRFVPWQVAAAGMLLLGLATMGRALWAARAEHRYDRTVGTT